MGTITGTQIATRARRILQDQATGGTRWLDAELLDWINDAQREVVLLKPNAKSVTADVAMSSGTKQSLPTGAIQLIDVVRNVGGPAITRVDRAVLDSENRSWHTASAAATAIHYVFDENAPETFYLYPQQPGSPGSVELVYSTAPTDLGSLASAISLNDIYAGPIMDYVLYRAYSKDAPSGSDQRALSHYTSFAQSLGIKGQQEQAVSPNATRQNAGGAV